MKLSKVFIASALLCSTAAYANAPNSPNWSANFDRRIGILSGNIGICDHSPHDQSGYGPWICTDI